MTQITIQQAIDLAVRHHQSGQLAEAEAIYRQILSADPNQPDALHLLGVIACQAGRFDVAVDLIRRAISIQPSSADFHCTLGNALQSLARHDEAIAAYRNGLSINPAHAEIHNNLGCALRDTGRTDDAITAFRQAITLRANYSEALNNLANAMVALGQLEPAAEQLRRSLSLAPNMAETHNSLGAAMEQQGRYAEAISSYRQAIALEPHHVEAHVNLGIALLRQGDYPTGLREYEWRLQRKGALAPSDAPRWQGDDLNGRTILLSAEQGFGDTIQFARYVPLVAERGGRVVLRCPIELRRLLQSSLGVEVIGDSDPTPRFDTHCPLASLPLVMGTTLDTIPSRNSYLHPERQIKIESSNRLKIGLAWAGRSTHRDDRNRSIPFDLLKELIQTPDATFVSLQKGATSNTPNGLVDRTAELDDFADTAGMMQDLDLIITVDTSIAHLAGALGKPTWVLLPFVPDWRWLLGRSDSPWYPTMRLFRQPAIGDWQTPIQQIASALHDFRGNS